MALVLHNHSVSAYTTFGIEAKAVYFTIVRSYEDLLELIQDQALNKLPWLILGGGSNILFTQDFNGLVIKNEIRGISVIEEAPHNVLLKSYSGEVWHDVVMHAIRNGWGGIENLSLIPGTIGAAPMQNIGAYGAELEQVFLELEAVDLKTGEIKIFGKEECRFGYRESIFKHEAKGEYFILSVTLELSRHAELNITYGHIKKVLEDRGIENPSISDVSDAVIYIRRSKLPDPAIIGNAGSFFKNPEIETDQYDKLKEKHPEMPGYPVESGKTKVPAGWLIEQCGWKGKRVGNTGSHKDQALVLVNYGGAEGSEVIALAHEIQASVKERFGIDIYPEVNII
jgi:UDP-N-acetylmuramate dehydrogenase